MFGLRPFALSSASFKLILWNGGWEVERRGVASQPTKVSFRANKNRRITETVDGASYRIGLAEKSYATAGKFKNAPEALQQVYHLLLNISGAWKKINPTRTCGRKPQEAGVTLAYND
uniref:Uncharacterized protein n=1 Tax=Timema poppense TaxID=170557 RepID=A0A7R9DCQ8_TIMPO|nr:unnamed protein product [Timema poppensis]